MDTEEWGWSVIKEAKVLSRPYSQVVVRMYYCISGLREEKLDKILNHSHPKNKNLLKYEKKNLV